MSLLPVDPMGWPMPIPEPFTLQISRSSPEFLLAAEVLGGEGLVELHELEVFELDARVVHEVADGRRREIPMMVGSHPP